MFLPLLYIQIGRHATSQVEEEICPPWQGHLQVKGSKIKISGFKCYTKDGTIQYLFRAVCPQK